MSDHTHDVLEHTYTTNNLHRKVVLLEEFFRNYFFKEHSGGNLKIQLKQFLIEENIGEYLRSDLLSLSDAFYSSFASDNFAQVLEKIKEEEQHRPHITLYVPTTLPPIEIEKLGKWARQNIAPGVFMDVEVDGKAVGGCAFVWNGVYHDFSLNYYMNKKRTEIKSLLKKP